MYGSPWASVDRLGVQSTHESFSSFPFSLNRCPAIQVVEGLPTHPPPSAQFSFFFCDLNAFPPAVF